MLSRRFRAVALALGAALAPACRGSAVFLLFDGSDEPQAELVARLRSARKHCAAAGADLGAAFHVYQRLTAPQAVELATLADEFEDALDACRERARDLTESCAALDHAADALFRDWNEELTRFSGETLRQKSAAMLAETEARAQRARSALQAVQEKLRPVLVELQDYALFFHHNLNARAIATLEDTYRGFDAEFHALEAELAHAREELDSFLAACSEPGSTP